MRDYYIETRIQAGNKRVSQDLRSVAKKFDKRLGSGEMLIAESIFRVSSSNFNTVTKELIIEDFMPTFFKEENNVNVKVNSAVYNTEAFSVLYGTNILIWKPGRFDAGFDLEEGDLIEVEVFSIV